MNISNFLHHHSHQHVSSRDHRDPFLKRITNDPYLDWLIIIIIALVVAGVFIVMGYFVYNDTQDSFQSGANQTNASNKVFNSDSLSKVIKEIDGRAVERANIMQGEAKIADPSL